ncbi:MAG: hypothetical protein WBE01_14695, partial [Methyloceanibacter sp.]
MRAIFLAATAVCLMGAGASAQPTKMDPSGVGALTGAMRHAGSPWLHHAIKDVGTNPTGWKRLWCAKSVNM